jgi:cell wall-associated NlpC family hydrolase
MLGRNTTRAAAIVLAAGGFVSAPPSLRVATAEEAVVLTTVENMYSGPAVDKDVVSQALLGQIVTVLETSGAFARIETPDRYPGWISRSALSTYVAGDDVRYARRGPVAEIVALVANVYREKDVTSARPKIKAPFGARLEVLDGPIADRWYEVRLPGGDNGFVQKGDLRVSNAADHPAAVNPAELVATGRRLLGVPYLWGGMTPLGLDCSGFVSLLYRAQGRLLPRDAGPQFRDEKAAPVERDQLAAGDLVFFGKTRDKITHVGLYVGGGRFLNATTYQTPAVREDSLDDPYWSALYQGARRPR